ncbi:O-methyltransferase [Streptomyces sp. Ag109_O5-1]|uniref:methyltransferase n=1 Tax=Streptomyces TaxID=1883 RepID=UPI000F4F98FB|nr:MULTISPECIES: methyltransferase [Streptomyces]RPE45875.1 O-methyltransferase [Streptomyces sp. Ag109_O5-1]
MSPEAAPDEAVDPRASSAFLVNESLGYLFPAALRVAAVVGVADHLAGGPRTAAELAEATRTDARSLYRVLRLLATRGIFVEDAGGRFRLTSVGDTLRSDAPCSARSAVLMNTDRSMWLPVADLSRCVSESTSAFEHLFGLPFFEYFAQDEDTADVFHTGMAAMSAAENEPIAAACEFPSTGTVVDVGGGHGGFLLAVLDHHPGLHGVLLDQPHVLAGHLLDKPGTAGRWSIESGDFFTAVPEGDVLVLKRILHDWEDDQCVTLLDRCRAALAPGGRIMVVDAVVPPGNTPHQAKTLDLLLMAVLVGRERTEPEFAALFEAAGLKLSRIVPTPTVLSVVEAVAA